MHAHTAWFQTPAANTLILLRLYHSVIMGFESLCFIEHVRKQYIPN
jgi:hypothetical protein